MAGSPIFSVNFTNRKNSAVLNYHKSWSWSNQPVLWDFYIMFLLVLSVWMFVTIFCPKHGVTGDVWCHNILTFHVASAENRREKSLRVSSLLELKSRGGTWVFFGWVCAARDSKLAPHSKKKFPSNWYPILEMGQFFIPRSRIRPITETPF